MTSVEVVIVCVTVAVLAAAAGGLAISVLPFMWKDGKTTRG
jgi:hypothetical protein